MHDSPSLRRHAPAALLVLGVLLPLGGAAVLGDPFEWGDTSRFFGPVRRPVVDALRAGRLPLWNPTATFGQPLFAEGMHGVLHPVSLAAAALDPAGRIAPLVLAYFVLAALGAFALARAFGSTGTAAFVAGVAYGLGGYVVSMGTNLVYLAGAASLPWMLAAGRSVGARGRGAAAVALATALAALSGEFQALFVGLVLALLFAAESGGLRAALLTAAGQGLGLALAGVQLVPSWAHLGRTVRSIASLGSTRMWPFSPWRLVELISPGFFMRFDADAASVFEALARKEAVDLDFPWAASVFIGLPVLLLAARGVRDRTGRVLLVCACVALWAAFGYHLGAAHLLGAVPLWGKFRYAEKMIGPFALLVAILAARGLDALRGGRAGRLVLAAWIGTAIGAVLGGAALLGAFDQLAPAAGKRLASGAIWVVAGSAATAALLRASRRPEVERLALAGLAAVVYAGSASAAHFAHRAGARMDVRGVARRIPPDPVLTRVAVPYTGVGPSVAGDDVFDRWLRSNARLPVPNYNVSLGLDTVGVYSALEPARYWAVRRPFWDERWKLFRRFGANRAVICWPTDANDARLAGIATAGASLLVRDAYEQVDVWGLPHRPWASFAPGVRLVQGQAEAVAELERLWRAGKDEVVVEAPSGERPFGTAAGRVLSIDRRNDRLRLEAESDGDGFLVVNDAWWEGWRATIDGAPVPILPVDGLVRGVRWPHGRHLLEMAYRPPEVRLGAIVSAIALAALVALAVAGSRRGRRDPA